jgi:hypothetical protein
VTNRRTLAAGRFALLTLATGSQLSVRVITLDANPYVLAQVISPSAPNVAMWVWPDLLTPC